MPDKSNENVTASQRKSRQACGRAAGQCITTYVTGQGAVQPAVASGAASPSGSLSYPTASVQVTIGGQPATVQFAGLAPGFVGLLQLNLLGPDVPAGDQPLLVTIGGIAANRTLVSVGAKP